MYFKDLNIDTIYYEWLGLWNFKFGSQKLLKILAKDQYVYLQKFKNWKCLCFINRQQSQQKLSPILEKKVSKLNL